MSKRILIIIVILILAFLSFASYRWFCGTKTVPVEESELAKLEKSKVIKFWLARAYGEITEISDRILTLSSGGENLAISVKEEARITSFTAIEDEEKEIQFEDLEVGNYVTVLAEVSLEGELKGINVTLFLKSPGQ